MLIVAATALEVRPLLDAYAVSESPIRGEALQCGSHQVLITGVGQMQTAYFLGRALAASAPEMVLNIGIAGSFNPQFGKCAVVQIGEEHLADLGAENGDSFLDLFDIKLLQPDEAPFSNRALMAPELPLPALTSVPRVRGVTVNRVLAAPRSIEFVKQKYAADVVSMEGAAVFYCCLLAKVPFLAVRAISDFVGPRDKAAWDIPGALKALTQTSLEILR